MKVYEITQGMKETLDIFLTSEKTEEDKENFNYVMEILKEELKTKQSNILKYIRNLTLEAEILSEEEERLKTLRKIKELKINNLKKYLTNILLDLKQNKIETDLGTIGLRKSTSVIIDDLNIVPKKYLNKNVQLIPDKLAIKDILKQGKNIKGVHLQENYSLQIK